MQFTEYISGPIPKDLISYNEFADIRKRTILTMDETSIRSMYARYGIKFPPKGKTFWQAVAEIILAMPDAPDSKVREAMTILNELNIEVERR